jgi:hypothetical protein
LKAAGSLAILLALLLFTGEWLCVNVAWRCTHYNWFMISFGTISLIIGLVMISVFRNE